MPLTHHSGDYRIAWFVTAHGYGHAARSCAVMNALSEQLKDVHFNVFTTIPDWFFSNSLQGSYTYYRQTTDVGLVQITPFEVDLTATIESLRGFFPVSDTLSKELAEKLKVLDCRLVVSDISPLGIEVAHKAGLPSVLVENFTWDWIYAAYLDHRPRLKQYIDYLSQVYESVGVHIQTDPICAPKRVDLTASPACRKPRTNAAQVRKALNIPTDSQLTVVTLGGIPYKFRFSDVSPDKGDIFVLVPGGADSMVRDGGLILLPTHSDFYHPDLIYAADAVIGKAGYSTLAEVYCSGVPFGYIKRRGYRESAVLEAYVEQHIPCLQIAKEDLEADRIFVLMSKLLQLPRRDRRVENGADQIARFLCESISY